MAQVSLFSMLMQADLLVQIVLCLLIGMSIITWGIIFQKWFSFRKITKESTQFYHRFLRAKSLDTLEEEITPSSKNPLARLFQSVYPIAHQETEVLERTLRSAQLNQQTQLESNLSFLAITASSAPFIGLLGTVWGILRAFQKLGGAGSASIQVVGPDIAHALVATAVGLIAAIPAAMAYNALGQKLHHLEVTMDRFEADLLNRLRVRGK